MDVAYYLSELLGQVGEVNVPGLGYFVQLRVDGYYNEEESTFYPPTCKLHFDPQSIDDDDVLLQYIADKKNISLASSKYFTEKYINNLTQQAMQQEVAFAELGWLYYDHEKAKIRFRPAEELNNDHSFYGYPKIALSKLGGTSIFEQIDAARPAPTYTPPVNPPAEPVYETNAPANEPILTDGPVSQPEVFAASPIYTPPAPSYTPPAPEYVSRPAAQEEEDFIFTSKTYDDDDEGRRSYTWIWITLLVLIMLTAGGIFALYKYKPTFFDRFKHIKPAPVVLKSQLTHDTTKNVLHADSTNDTSKKQPGVIIDTTAKGAVPNQPLNIIDSAKTRYEVMGVSAKTLQEADRYIRNFKSQKIDAHIVNDATGRRIQISLGTFMARPEAIIKRDELLKSGKVPKDIYVLPFNPKR